MVQQKAKQVDYHLRPIVAKWRPELAKRMRFWRQKKGEQKIVKVVQQLYDEIIPHIEYKPVAGFAALKVPFGIIKGFLTNQSHEKAAPLHTVR